MKVLGLIPARSGSKGVPDKNIRKLGGYPLIQWSINACKLAKYIDRVIVSTDSEYYGKIAKQMGAEVPFLRPVEISQDFSTDYEFIINVLDNLSKKNEEPLYISHIRPTTPLRLPKLIDRDISMFLKSKDATALRSVHEMSESAYKVFEIASTGQLKRIACKDTNLDEANNARQEFPKTYTANGYVDVLSVTYIKKSGLLHGNNVLPFITPFTQEIDTEKDLQLIEREVEMDNKILKELFKGNING